MCSFVPHQFAQDTGHSAKGSGPIVVPQRAQPKLAVSLAGTLRTGSRPIGSQSVNRRGSRSLVQTARTVIEAGPTGRKLLNSVCLTADLTPPYPQMDISWSGSLHYLGC